MRRNTRVFRCAAVVGTAAALVLASGCSTSEKPSQIVQSDIATSSEDISTESQTDFSSDSETTSSQTSQTAASEPPSDRGISPSKNNSDNRSGRSTENKFPANKNRTPQRMGTANAPSQVLNLRNWYLTLPVGADHQPQTIQPNALASYSSPQWFHLNAARDGVVFVANAGGVTTKNSKYPRTELREMSSDGSQKASWSNTSGTHVMTVTQAVTKLTVAKPQTVTAQIHDAEDDIIEVVVDGKRKNADGSVAVCLRFDGKTLPNCMDTHYVLGTKYTVRIEASGGRILVDYNGKRVYNLAKSGTGWYFKTGCYVQSNPEKGESPSATSEVVLYNLKVTHT